MNRLIHILFLFVWVHGAVCQVPFNFTDSLEKEDSISSLSIKLLKPSQTRKLLKQVIKRFKQDLLQEGKTGRYQIEATFSRDTLAPFFARRTITAESGIALSGDGASSDDFKYEGTYELTYLDSTYIAHYLNTFPLLSPNYVPWVKHLYYTIRGHIDKDALLPFENYSETLFYYNVTAYSIVDAADRGVYRIIFSRNSMERLGRDVVYGKKYDVGEVTGTAYFDSQTLRIKQFKGKARVPTEMHVIHYRFQNNYDEDNSLPVLRQTKVVWEAKGTKIKATVQRIDEM